MQRFNHLPWKAGFGAALRILIGVAIALTVFVAYGLVNNAWYKVLAVEGGSMEPTISQGDMIVITPAPDRVEVGMVLTLQVDGAVVTHRVVEIADDGSFITKGDANDARDDFSENDVHIVGIYRFGLPVIGTLLEPLTSAAWVNDAAVNAGTASSGEWPEPAMPARIIGAGDFLSAQAEEASPTPSATATPTPIPTAESSAAATSIALPALTQAPSPTSMPTPTEAASATPTPSPSDAPSPSAAGASPSVTAGPDPTESPWYRLRK
jgi:signal peptidase I